jgi:hypothetical protein
MRALWLLRDYGLFHSAFSMKSELFACRNIVHKRWTSLLLDRESQRRGDTMFWEESFSPTHKCIPTSYRSLDTSSAHILGRSIITPHNSYLKALKNQMGCLLPCLILEISTFDSKKSIQRARMEGLKLFRKRK